MNKLLFLAVFVGFISIFTSSPVHAQGYNLNNKTLDNYQWGNTFNLPGRIRQQSGEIEIFNADIGFDPDSVIGCSGINLKNAFKGILGGLDAGQITDQIKDYFTTSMANYLLTQVYSSPAIAAIFDSLEAFGNARVSMMQQKCMSGPKLRQAGAEAWAARNAQDECVKKYETDGNKKTSGADCFKENSKEIADKIKKNLSLEEYSGSLYSMLGGKDSLGKLTDFIPDFKFCTGNARCDFDKPTKKPEKLGQGEMLGLSKAGSGAYLSGYRDTAMSAYSELGDEEVNRRLDVAYSVQNEYIPQNIIIAGMAERSFENPFISNIQLGVTDFALTHGGDEYAEDDEYDDEDEDNGFGGLGADWKEMDKVMLSKAKTKLDNEFITFINCQNPAFGIVTAKFFKGNFPEIKAVTYTVDLGQYKNINFGNGGGTSFSDAMSKSGGLTEVEKEVLQSFNLLGLAVSCVYNHNISMSPVDFFKLSQMGSSKSNAVLDALADKISFLSVEVVLRFMKHKLLDAYASGTFTIDKKASDGTVETDANGDPVKQTAPFPPHILSAVKMISDTIENRIATLNAVRRAQDDFSSMMRKFYSNE